MKVNRLQDLSSLLIYCVPLRASDKAGRHRKTEVRKLRGMLQSYTGAASGSETGTDTLTHTHQRLTSKV